MSLGTRSPNFKSFRVTAPSGGYAVNTLALVASTLVCFPLAIAEAAVGAGIYFCEKVVLPKDTGVTLTAGEPCYFNAATGKLTSTPGTFYQNRLCGRVLVTAGTAATEVEVDFDGSLTPLASPYKTLSVTAPTGGYAAGSMAAVEDTVLYFPEAIAEGAVGIGIYRGVVTLPKKTGTGTGPTKGDMVFFIAADKLVTKVGASNTCVGRALATAADGVGSVLCDFDGAAASHAAEAAG